MKNLHQLEECVAEAHTGSMKFHNFFSDKSPFSRLMFFVLLHIIHYSIVRYKLTF